MNGLLNWPMQFLTPQEQKVLIVVFILLATGFAVKTWRLANPDTEAAWVSNK